LDEVTNQKSNGRKQRIQTYSDAHFAEETSPPPNAPEWTISRYNGSLRRRVVSVCSNDENEEDTTEIENTNEHQRKRKKRRR